MAICEMVDAFSWTLLLLSFHFSFELGWVEKPFPDLFMMISMIMISAIRTSCGFRMIAFEKSLGIN